MDTLQLINALYPSGNSRHSHMCFALNTANCNIREGDVEEDGGKLACLRLAFSATDLDGPITA
jgi:hypothetical protein